MINRTEIIAEIGQAHDGSLGLLYSYVDALADVGVTTIKFQAHFAEYESSVHETFRKPFSLEDASRFDYWKRMELTENQWKSLKEYCDSKKVRFLCSPFSMHAVRMMDRIGVDRFKLGSGCIGNFPMMDLMNDIGKPVILSSGLASSDDAIDNAIRRMPNIDVAIMHCTTEYPTSPKKIRLNRIVELRELFPSNAIGFSDHSGRSCSAIAAATLGAELYEAHVVFDRRMFGPDAQSSLTINEFKALIDNIRFLEKALGHGVVSESQERYSELFGYSLCAARDLLSGHVLTLNDIETKKPVGHGISTLEIDFILGKRLTFQLAKGTFINYSDLQ